MPMPILASVCWKAGSVWVCGGRVCGIPRARVCWFGARVFACACGCVCVGGPRLCARPPLVVCCGGFPLSRTPWGAVPLARPGLASRFGMLLGVSPVL